MPRRLALAVSLLLAIIAALPAGASAGTNCDVYAGPFGLDSNPGTAIAPFKTAQKLSSVLNAGQTGCLLAGTYTDEVTGPYVLNVLRRGAPGAPITIRSAPGQRATLRGIVQVPQGSDYVTLSNLDIYGQRLTPDESTGVQIQAQDTVFEDNVVTNGSRTICMVLGSPGWGQAVRTVIQRNTFRDCGRQNNKYEHSVYVDYTDGVLITDNLFLRSGGYAVHMYPNAQRTTVTHNVMVGNGGGVIFAGEGDAASSDAVVEQNIITDSTMRPGIESWWGGAVGQRNLASRNCVIRNVTAQVDLSGGGFVASGNIIADPGFRDAARDDYRLDPASPCLSLVGYDTAAKLAGDPSSSPTPTPTATAAPTSTPAPSPTPAATTSPTATPSPAPTATATPTPTTTEPPATLPVASPTAPAVQDGTQPQTDPEPAAVEGAQLFVDDGAFSASGGSACKPRRNRC